MNLKTNLYFFLTLLGLCLGCNDFPNTTELPVESVNYPNDQRIMHYWDYMDKADFVKLMSPDGGEQALVDFFHLLSNAPTVKQAEGITKMVEKVINDKQLFEHFLPLYEKYLYDPNSPMRNEKWYSTLIGHIIASPKISEMDKVRLRYQFNIIGKNNVGQIVENFEYQNFNSNINENIHDIRSSYLLLFFYDPECNYCQKTTAQLTASNLLTALQHSGKLKILAIYPYSNKKTWENYNSRLPAFWINGWGNELEASKEQKYDLRALPSLYLLDKNKKVLLKDVAVKPVEQFLKTGRQMIL